MIAALFEAGTDVFRLNFSHGLRDDHRRVYDNIRRAESDFGRPIGIMMDLQGPKLRVGNFSDSKIELAEGASFRLDLDDALGNAKRVSLPHTEIFEVLHEGANLLLDDGKIQLTVEKYGPDFAETRVVRGGSLSDHKGVNLPGIELMLSPLTPKDREDLQFGLELGVDWVALSFVQRPEDVAEARKLIAGRPGRTDELLDGDLLGIVIDRGEPERIAADAHVDVVGDQDRRDFGVDVLDLEGDLEDQVVHARALAGAGQQ